MDYKAALKEINEKMNLEFSILHLSEDEVYLLASPDDFKNICLALHKLLHAPVASFFAQDARKEKGAFKIYCSFMSAKYKKWFFVVTEIPQDNPKFDSLAKEIYSASLFEREIKEMFGIEPIGNPDLRRLRLHDEIWPNDVYPLRKDFKVPELNNVSGVYCFNKVEGEGIFEIPVGPVHAGIIGPGHFRFSSVGEPIINLEIRLGFTHRGIEKFFEGKNAGDALRICECVSGDASFAHSLSYAMAIEKISGIKVLDDTRLMRAVFLELERMYNHINDIGGMAVDVGFSFPAAFASIVKENILQLNEKITGSRYLRNINCIGGITMAWDKDKTQILRDSLKKIYKDFDEIKKILLSSVSFMDRADGTGILKKKTAEDMGITGLAGRASGIAVDLRKDFPGIYGEVNFNLIKQATGDCLGRLFMRISEFEDSIKLIRQFLDKLETHRSDAPPHKSTGLTVEDRRVRDPLISGIRPQAAAQSNSDIKEGFALGYVESWRGPVLYWVKLDKAGAIERCKIVDASFLNWQGLSFCVLGDIIPDFPLCNKSFDLSYSGNDL